MNRFRYKVVNEYSFSILHSNVYVCDDSILSRLELKRLGKENEFATVFFLDDVTNANEEFFAKRIRYLEDSEDYINKHDYLIRKHYTNLVLSPPKYTNILWPQDIIEMPNNILDRNTLLITNNYRVFEDDVTRDVSHFALLFSKNINSFFCGINCNLVDYLKRIRKTYGYNSINYRNSIVRKLAWSISETICNLNKDGYLYNDIDLSRFFVLNNMKIGLDFSNLIYSYDEYELLKKKEVFIEEPEEYPLSYADPARYQQKIEFMDEESQNYSLTALLFNLLFGRAPYEGEKYDYMQGATVMSHVNKYQQILSSPIFIFDRNDRSNQLGESSEYDLCKELWMECDTEIKELFYKALIEQNATRNNVGSLNYSPTPQKWLSVFKRLKWDEM